MIKILATKIKQLNVMIPVASSVILTLFLFYIDEGYYNFHWMHEAGNWFAFGIYVVTLIVVQLFFQLATRFIVGKGVSNKSIATGSAIIGSVVGLIFLFILLS